MNNVFFDCLFYDKVSGVTYGVHNGYVYIVDSGYVNTSQPDGESLAYLKSKVYRPGGSVSWTRIRFFHNTGGAWFRLEIYLDEVFKNSFPFMSTERTKGDFRFGPHAGYDFQFIITGNYKAFGKIYYPIGVYHSG